MAPKPQDTMTNQSPIKDYKSSTMTEETERETDPFDDSSANEEQSENTDDDMDFIKMESANNEAKALLGDNKQMFGACEVEKSKRLAYANDKEETAWGKLIKDKDAMHFGVRVGVILSMASLFVLAHPEDEKGFPQGTWVVISALMVSWFPSLDAASVIEKAIQRFMGTCVGATLGLVCGFLSLTMPSDVAQSIFLTCCMLVVPFGVSYTSVHFSIDRAKIINRYNYASVLCLLTFIISVLPFYDDGPHPKWYKSVFRVINVLIGCILASVASVVVLPRSTANILENRICRQIKLAGESSEAILHAAADSFSGNMSPIPLASEMLELPYRRRVRISRLHSRRSFRAVDKRKVYDGGDVALEKYESAIKDWRVTKALYPLLRYDPFAMIRFLGLCSPRSPHIESSFYKETANTLARALRIQTTVVLLDGMIRNDPKQSFSDDQLMLFAEIGTLIRHMLTVPLNHANSLSASHDLMERLTELRRFIVDVAAKVATEKIDVKQSLLQNVEVGPLSDDDDTTVKKVQFQRLDSGMSGGRCAPKHVKGSNVCALLFLQLVEHLILRSLRLYQAWKQVEEAHEMNEHAK